MAQVGGHFRIHAKLFKILLYKDLQRFAEAQFIFSFSTLRKHLHIHRANFCQSWRFVSAALEGQLLILVEDHSDSGSQHLRHGPARR